MVSHGAFVERQFGEKWIAMMPVWPLVSRLGDWQSRRGSLKVQLRDAIADLILSGELSEGSRLPSERHLSQAIAVSRNTIAGTYALLTEDGLVQQRRGSGSVVHIDRRNAARILRRSREVERIFQFGQSEDAGDPIDFCISSVELLPRYFETIAFDAHDAAELNRHMAYNPYGLPALREAIARKFTEHGLLTAPEEILVTTGGQQAIDLAVRLFVERGDSVALESPTFFVALDALRVAGARLNALPNYDRRNELRDMLIHANARMIYVIPTLQNPTGKTMTDEQRRLLAETAAQLQIPVIEDATLENLRYDGVVPRLVAQFGSGASVISIGSLNKEFWSGLRIGWMRAERATIARLARLKTAADLTTSLWSQAVAIRALERIDDIRAARRAELRDRCQMVERLIAEHLPDWQYEPPHGSFSLWIQLPTADARPFVHLARRFGVRIISGSEMTVDEGCASYVRIVFTADPELIERGIFRLRDAWHAYAHYAQSDTRTEAPLAI